MIHIIEKLQTDQQNWPKLDGPLTEEIQIWTNEVDPLRLSAIMRHKRDIK